MLELLSYNMTPGIYGSLAVSGTHAYITDRYRGKIDIVDVSNPISPTLPASYSIQEPVQIEISGTLAYVATWTGGLSILDISQPLTPSQLSFLYGTGYTWDIKVLGNYVYMAAASSGLSIIDVANPSRPQLLARWNGVTDVNAVVVVGQYAYLRRDSGSLPVLHIIDISDPRNPTQIGTVPAGSRAMASSGGYLYMHYDQGLGVMDLSDPRHPNMVNYIPNYWIEDIFFDGNRAYIAGAYNNHPAHAGITVLEVSDLSNPIEIGRGELPSTGWRVKLKGNNVYAIDVSVFMAGYKSAGGLAIFDKTLRPAPTATPTPTPIPPTPTPTLWPTPTPPGPFRSYLPIASTTTGNPDNPFQAVPTLQRLPSR